MPSNEKRTRFGYLIGGFSVLILSATVFVWAEQKLYPNSPLSPQLGELSKIQKAKGTGELAELPEIIDLPPKKETETSSSISEPTKVEPKKETSQLNQKSLDEPDNSASVPASKSLIYHGNKCSVDSSNFPELEEFANKIGLICDTEYPKLVEILKGQDIPVQLVIKDGMENAGEADGSTISLSASWFKLNQTDTGAVVHELVHVVQNYPVGNPFWLVEGIADYYRYQLGYSNDWSYAHCGPGSERYSSGYWCSAALLTYIEKQSPGIILELNRVLRLGVYEDEIFLELTNQSIDQHWQLCLESTCRGGQAD